MNAVPPHNLLWCHNLIVTDWRSQLSIKWIVTKSQKLKMIEAWVQSVRSVRIAPTLNFTDNVNVNVNVNVYVSVNLNLNLNLNVNVNVNADVSWYMWTIVSKMKSLSGCSKVIFSPTQTDRQNKWHCATYWAFPPWVNTWPLLRSTVQHNKHQGICVYVKFLCKDKVCFLKISWCLHIF